MSTEPASHVLPPPGPAVIPHGFTMPASAAGLECDPPLVVLPEIASVPPVPGFAAKAEPAASGPPPASPAVVPPIHRQYIAPQESEPN